MGTHGLYFKIGQHFLNRKFTSYVYMFAAICIKN